MADRPTRSRAKRDGAAPEFIPGEESAMTVWARINAPVESDFERRALRAILHAQRELHARGVDVAINKPLFDTMTPHGPCRPDFILEARSRVTGELRTVVVEAMGFNDEEYEAAKAVTHPRMAVLGNLVTLDRSEMDQDLASTKLLRVLNI